jgi:hypothetical protein
VRVKTRKKIWSQRGRGRKWSQGTKRSEAWQTQQAQSTTRILVW